MLKTLTLTAMLGLTAGLTAGLAQAAETPTTAEQCHTMLDKVTEGADPAKLADDVLGKLDELMTVAERQCDTGQYAEVVKTAELIKSTLTETMKN